MLSRCISGELSTGSGTQPLVWLGWAKLRGSTVDKVATSLDVCQLEACWARIRWARLHSAVSC